MYKIYENIQDLTVNTDRRFSTKSSAEFDSQWNAKTHRPSIRVVEAVHIFAQILHFHTIYLEFDSRIFQRCFQIFSKCTSTDLDTIFLASCLQILKLWRLLTLIDSVVY